MHGLLFLYKWNIVYLCSVAIAVNHTLFVSSSFGHNTASNFALTKGFRHLDKERSAAVRHGACLCHNSVGKVFVNQEVTLIYFNANYSSCIWLELAYSLSFTVFQLSTILQQYLTEAGLNTVVLPVRVLQHWIKLFKEILKVAVCYIYIYIVLSLHLQPFSTWLLDKGEIVRDACDMVRAMLAADFTPILHGDVVLDTSRGCAIISSDTIAEVRRNVIKLFAVSNCL